MVRKTIKPQIIMEIKDSKHQITMVNVVNRPQTTMVIWAYRLPTMEATWESKENMGIWVFKPPTITSQSIIILMVIWACRHLSITNQVFNRIIEVSKPLITMALKVSRHRITMIIEAYRLSLYLSQYTQIIIVKWKG